MGRESFSLPVWGGLVKFHLVNVLSELKPNSMLILSRRGLLQYMRHEVGWKDDVLIAWDFAQHWQLGTPFAEPAACLLRAGRRGGSQGCCY